MTAAYAGADLLALQGNIKRDPDGYKDEFLLQYRHYMALLELFKLKPTKETKEFADLAMFMAQVVKCYPRETSNFAAQVMDLLDTHFAVLDSGLRRVLVQALILMRNRSQLDALTVLPLFFRLFRCQDKQLRHQLFKHIVSDIKNANKHHRNEKLNRSLQNFMYGIISDDNEAIAKKSLAVCTELWRRHVWRDARTVNVIASAAFHKSSRVMLAVLKFFLGQDAIDEAGSDDEEGRKNWDEEAKAKMPSKQDLYRAYNKGTRSSKKKKERKMNRVMETVKKATRKGQGSHSESFAALHLMHDPQTFVEKLFSRLQSSHEKFETRTATIQVVSRVIGVHKLLVLNFYPYLQKYIAPHQRDVTVILASLVMACHELVPPETLAPVLKQLVDQFVHDKARPEVMTVGLKTVRELCLRTPLVMNETLLQDLAMYRKFREKEVATAARGLIGLFREINPALLTKKDRGRGADLDAKPRGYGEIDVKDRVDGAELLQAAIAAGQGSEDDEFHMEGSSDSDLSDIGKGEGEDEDEDEDAEARDGDENDEGEGEDLADEDNDWDSEDIGSSDDEDAEAEEGGGEDKGEEDEDEEDEDEEEASASGRHHSAAKKLDKKEGSLASLKKQLAEAKARKAAIATATTKPEEHSDVGGGVPDTIMAAGAALIEADRFLTPEDFERIKRLKQKALVEAAMSKHGLQGASKAKRRRILEAAEAEAQEVAELQALREKANETRVSADDLKGRHKRHLDKAERMESVLAGREGREKFGSSVGRKKQKTGGLTEREKQKRKAMPIAARVHQVHKRSEFNRKLKACKKNFKGHSGGGA